MSPAFAAAAATALLGVLSTVLTAYFGAMILANGLYLLRPDSGDLSNAWGGPTMAGAWAVHAGLCSYCCGRWRA